MKAVGIVAEYNPFHNGHKYLINQAKQITGAPCAVVVMNGSFMQRGEPAFIDKYTRTRMALHAGADMIFELPTAYGVSSAEDFALGSISLLHSLGFVDSICFGSEDGDINRLMPYCDFFSTESPEYKKLLTNYCRMGIGFPAARARAVADLLDTSKLADIQSPNNLLGIEYLKALKKLSSSMKPFTIKRIGSGYHDIAPNTYSSATGIRKILEKDPADIVLSQSIPSESLPFLKETLSHYSPVILDDFSPYIYYSLLSHFEELSRFKDVSDDLADRIRNQLSNYRCASQFVSILQTKQLTTGRIKRCLCQIMLGVTKDSACIPLRLLGLNPQFSYLLKEAEGIIAKPAKAKEALRQDFFASDLYAQAVLAQSGYVLGGECTHSPILI